MQSKNSDKGIASRDSAHTNDKQGLYASCLIKYPTKNMLKRCYNK